MTWATYIRRARWVRRAYAAPRRRFHPVIKQIPRPIHRFLDFPKTRVEASP